MTGHPLEDVDRQICQLLAADGRMSFTDLGRATGLSTSAVHQLESYDREHGISYWTKNYRTSIERTDADALTRTYEYYDPIHTLPEEGQEWWRQHAGDHLAHAEAAAKASREAAERQKTLAVS